MVTINFQLIIILVAIYVASLIIVIAIFRDNWIIMNHTVFYIGYLFGLYSDIAYMLE